MACSRGQLGHGEIENEASPRLLDALDGLKVKAVAAGGWHSMAVSGRRISICGLCLVFVCVM